eukprot:CAMPEP_0119412776 /NCGR_PEP_ID=MMETSP1335-20130426/5097_1 /TAXON_ID=259385 /ORGANISM="Chrysoculter rhomboideus, Strain RCC1486" /LENGTH=123 /DNA_ID=CAMNT_0007437531 /DNA_START=331 /DNA_END=698 /DNA_ORIENTATION=+
MALEEQLVDEWHDPRAEKRGDEGPLGVLDVHLEYDEVLGAHAAFQEIDEVHDLDVRRIALARGRFRGEHHLRTEGIPRDEARAVARPRCVVVILHIGALVRMVEARVGFKGNHMEVPATRVEP